MGNQQQPKELSFNVNGMHFAAQSWGKEKNFPILALHGWLDNSASFFSLAPKLKNNFVVAVDMAGHGQTNHRPGVGPYNIWEDISEVFAIADQMGWEKFGLLGHSRGAIIATLAAGTFPERITRLALIEGILPEPMRSEDAPKQLATSIKGVKSQAAKPLSLYPDIAAAISAREHGMFPLSYEAAKLLTERGIKKVEGGFQWSTDRRLLVPSAIKLLPEQVAAFINRATCPIKLVLASDGMPKMYPPYQSEVEKFAHVSIHLIEGTHHVHMEKSVEKIAEIFNDYLKSEIINKFI